MDFVRTVEKKVRTVEKKVRTVEKNQNPTPLDTEGENTNLKISPLFPLISQ